MRALAALSVLLAHTVGPVLPGLAKYAFTGIPAVFAFFVISGFCIHTPFVNARLPVAAFLLARLVRIGIPTLTAFSIARMLGILPYNFVDGFILWSVVCELWYYALYPLFLVVSRRIGWWPMIVASIVAAYAMMLSIGSDQYGNIHVYGPWLNWIAGLPAWLLGAALAQSLGSNRPKLSNVWLWRGVVACTASALYWATLNSAAGAYLTMNIFAFLVVGWMLAEIQNARGRNWLDWVGRWSFSMYLFHIIAANMLESIGNTALIVAGALALCYLFFLLVEKPAHGASRYVFRLLESLTSKGGIYGIPLDRENHSGRS